MQTSDFHYKLPPELIAQYPLPKRSASRLLCLNGETGNIEDRRFAELPFELRSGDLLVFNNTRVIPARLYGKKSTGGRVEVLIERLLGDQYLLAQIRASKPLKPGGTLFLEEDLRLRVVDRQGEFYELEILDRRPVSDLLQAYGHIPLPPYIDRPDQDEDRARYQTVYARHPGAVAAPTAGLHFDEALLAALAQMQVHSAFITLHVGAGTFQPVRSTEISKHRMHPEYFSLSHQVCDAVAQCRERGGRVVAVGTTTVRALESVAVDGHLKPYQGDTCIFITPGFRFRVVDMLITNFHLPESTLLMLVSAFAGYARVMSAYRHAVNRRYRFYSYGDAMLITRQADVDMYP
ncbi:MAG: tRNA preQ1(34) S-adenosylmethionine ribosyltransferase-isomerase QueA [Pseudomonadota bacterium]